MSVAFPAGYYLTKESTATVHRNVATDRMDDGSMHVRLLGSESYDTIRCVLPYLSQVEYLSFKAWFLSARADEVTMVLDGQSYTGYIASDLSVTRNGGYFRAAFDYYAST